MKKLITAFNLILAFSIFCPAQGGNDQGAGGSVLLSSGANLEARLETALDVKKSKPGDEVILKTTKAVKQNGEIVVAKGARLVGRVTEVQQKTKDGAASKLSVVFQRIQGKNFDAPISATIVAITESQADASLGDTLDAGLTGNSTSAGSVSSGGGGLLGGAANTVGGVVNAATQTVGGVTNTTAQTLGGTAAAAAGGARGALKGISLSQSADASASGATSISSNAGQLRLEKGAVFRLRLNESIEK
jgi:hypothetical protein